MIKAHKNTAEAAVYALRYIINAGVNWEGLLTAMGRMRNGPYDRYIVSGAQTATLQQPPTDISQSLSELARSVWFEPGRVAGGGNLIESVARILTQDLARNRLTGDSVRRLREVLLLPDEIAAAENIQTNALSCAACHVRFVDGDVLTKRGDAFFCSACIPAYIVRCSHKGCEERVAILNHEKVLTKRCEAHKREAPPAAAPLVEPEQPNQAQAQGDADAAARVWFEVGRNPADAPRGLDWQVLERVAMARPPRRGR